MKRFALSAKDLQIKKLPDNIRFGNQSQQDNVDENTSEDMYEEQEYENISSNLDEMINLDIPGSDESQFSKQLYKCKECEASYKHRKSLWHHTSSKHEGICYSCKYCGYKAKQQSALKTHQESVHEGVRYECNQCDYLATRPHSLKRHKKSVHKDV